MMRERVACMSAFALAMVMQACADDPRSGRPAVPGGERDAQARHDAQARMDASVGDADVPSMRDGGGSSAALSRCFDPATVPSCRAFMQSSTASSHQYGELLDATSWGEGWRFVAMGGLAVLARQMQGSDTGWRVAALGIERVGNKYQNMVRELRPRWVAAGGRYTVLDVWGRPESEPVFDADAFALACRMGSCAILAARRQDQERMLTPLVDVELQADVEASLTGLVVAAGRVCVFGDGLYCYDGNAWSELLSVAEAPGIRDVSLGNPQVAVGEAGLIQVNEGSGWYRAHLGTAMDGAFEHVDTVKGHVAALREDGVLYRGKPQSLSRCRQPRRLVLAHDHVDGRPNITHVVMDETGSVYSYSWNVHTLARAWCRRVTVERNTPVVGYTSASCGIWPNLFLLTEQKLFSLLDETPMCAIAGA